MACNCTDFPAQPLSNGRQPNNTYNQTSLNHLPESLRTIATGHLDALIDYAPPNVALVALTGTAVALYNNGNVLGNGAPWYSNVDGAGQDVFDMVNIFKHHQNERAAILQHFDLVSLTGANAAARNAAQLGGQMCTQFIKDMNDPNMPKAKTEGELEDRTAPLARMWLKLSKFHSLDPAKTLSKISSGMWSKETGEKVSEFERLNPISDAHILHVIIIDFQRAIYAFAKHGGKKAWDPFWEFVFELMRANKTPQFVHGFVFKVLKDLDRTSGLHIVRYMMEKIQNSLMIYASHVRENGKPDPIDPTDQAKDDDEDEGFKNLNLKSNRVRFGPVTKQGECTGEVRTKNGYIAFCNQWNSSEPCTRGVANGPNKGKCAYTHRCRLCKNTSDHRSEEKDANGAWKCPKHA